jgi:serine/threonine protein kinase
VTRNPVESALAAFEAAHFAGEAPDPDAFCAAHAEAGPGLREAIADFLMVIAGLAAAEAAAPRGTCAPEALGAYRMVRVLGEGGMGTVFLAEQTSPVRRQVAIKLVRPGHHAAALRSRFERERQALARMNHENIARVFEAAATDDGRPYLVMEYVEGQPITEHCDAKRLGLRERLTLFVAVCDAIQHAHQKGVVHRDLKPGNVLVTMQGERALPKVIDFGLARATGGIDLEAGSLHTLDGQVLGTPEYMSPEQTGLEGIDVDARTDVYSLGALLHELLVGAVPLADLRAGSVATMQRRIREEEPVLPSARAKSGALSRSLRGDLDAIVQKALEKDRDHRYQTALDLAADVGRYLRQEPVQAGVPGTWYRMRKFLRRHRLQAAISLLLLIGLLVSLALAVSLYLKADEANRYFRLLATSARLSNADAEREALYPAWPQNAAANSAWLARHADVADELPELEGALRAVATRARPAAIAGAPLQFDDPLDQFVHDYLRPLIGRLRAWADPERGQVRGVRDDSRVGADGSPGERARRVPKPGERAAAEVAAEPRYAGFRLTPQLGLVPVGRDPTSPACRSSRTCAQVRPGTRCRLGAPTAGSNSAPTPASSSCCCRRGPSRWARSRRRRRPRRDPTTTRSPSPTKGRCTR